MSKDTTGNAGSETDLLAEREQFEAWVKERLKRDIRRYGDNHSYAAGRYRTHTVQVAWEAWCASLYTCRTRPRRVDSGET